LSANLYETDRSAWLEQQARLLKTGQLRALDIDHLTEALELEMGNERREMYRRLRILLGHLLKWQYQSEHRSASWAGTVRVQRKDLNRLLKDSPSLRRFLEPETRDAYADAVELASVETGLTESAFPAQCPYRIEDLLDKEFWPEAIPN
jgi:hypothetical protein